MPKKVLVVDDEPAVLQLIANRLKVNGFEVSTATSGGEALKSAEENHPDLIILDILMPVMDGIQTARKLKHNNLTSSIPIIMLTAVTQPDVVDKAMEVGAVDYVAKPFQAKVLMEKVRKIIP